MINIEIIFYSFYSFFILLLFQLILWRLVDIKRQMLVLFVLYFGVPVLFFALFLVSNYWSFLQSFSFFVLIIGLSVFFIQTFPAIQAKSPSIEIILFVSSMKNRNLVSKSDIENSISSKRLLDDRVEDLINDGLVKLVSGQLVLSLSGRILAGTFYYYRKLLCLEKGKG